MRRTAILVIAVLLSGLLLGFLIAPLARADGTRRYEYRCEKGLPVGIWGAVDALNRLGADGWRLLPTRYSVTKREDWAGDVYCFERER
ncbi:MAG TPA: hypothetical protein VG389_06570 [Myxococcota bacterium]|jgi:hypothetical protein|nr:hypothetical protein [Myxococcota bacterium]